MVDLFRISSFSFQFVYFNRIEMQICNRWNLSSVNPNPFSTYVSVINRLTSFGGTKSNVGLTTWRSGEPVPLRKSMQSENSPKSSSSEGDLNSFSKTSGLCGYKGHNCKENKQSLYRESVWE